MSQREAEVDEASQVDRGAAVGEPDAVAGDAAVADFAAAAAGEPGDGAFDHRAVLPVGLGERGGEGVGSGGGEQVVMDVDLEDLAAGGAGAALTQRAAVAAPPKRAWRDVRLIVTVIPLGQVAVSGQVDREVVDREPVGDGGCGAGSV